jgi:hypothetical protein
MALDLEKIAEELSGLFVPVSTEDANDYKSLQQKLITCNSYQDTIVKRLTEVEPVLAKQENGIQVKKFTVDTRKHEIKTTVKAVMTLPTGKERDEAANAMLNSDLEEILKMENHLNDLKVAKNALVVTLRKLKTTEQNIKLLKSMLDEQVTKLNVGSTGDSDVAHLQKSLGSLENLEEQLEDELSLDDVESSEEFINEESVEGESSDTECASLEDSLNDIEDSVDSESPTTECENREDSLNEVEKEDSSETSHVLEETLGGDELDAVGMLLDEEGSDNPAVDVKVPDENSDPEPQKKRTPIEEILGEDLPDDEPPSVDAGVDEIDIDLGEFDGVDLSKPEATGAEEEVKDATDQLESELEALEDVDTSDIDQSSIEDELRQATGAEADEGDGLDIDMSDLSEDAPVEELVQKEEPVVEQEDETIVEEKASDLVEEEVPTVVEDDASIGEEFDIESLLDM